MARHRAPHATPRAVPATRGPGRHADRRPAAARTRTSVLAALLIALVTGLGIGTGHAITPDAPGTVIDGPAQWHPAGGTTADVLPIGTDHIPGLPAVGAP
jgi:hypothetical protein